jgi:hypothetical protein
MAEFRVVYWTNHELLDVRAAMATKSKTDGTKEGRLKSRMGSEKHV